MPPQAASLPHAGFLESVKRQTVACTKEDNRLHNRREEGRNSGRHKERMECRKEGIGPVK